jgi:protein TonB
MAPLIFHRWTGSGGRRPAFGVCVVAVLAVHVLVLYLLGHRGLSLSHGIVAPGATFQTRVVTGMAMPHAEPVAAVPDIQSTAISQPLVLRNAELHHPTLAQQNADSSAQAVSAVLNSPADGRRGDQVDYVPREFLSLAPAPLSAIEVLFPDSVKEEVKIDVQLALFIDERGVVQRVRVEGAGLPPVLADAAVAAFREARFTPGQVDGQAVRSLIKVAVTFESQAVKGFDRTH